MKDKETEETKESEVTIGFGTLFEIKRVPNRVDVVLDVGEEDWFSSAKIIETKEGKKALSMVGTAGPDNIERITGQLSFDEVIAAFGEGTKMRGYELSNEERELLEKYSRKKPRTLKLNEPK